MAAAIWAYWLVVADDSAFRAKAERATDAEIDSLGEIAYKQGGPTFAPADGERSLGDRSLELHLSMVAVTAAAQAIDGFYGSLPSSVRAPRRANEVHRRRRPRVILEALKFGFAIGPMANGWQRELDWLFGLRDRLAHSRMAMEEVVVVRRTRKTVISSVPLALELTAISAQRAAVFSRAVVATCVAHPKAATTEWADFAAKLASATFHG
jgi:hypothetical protein